MEKGAIEAIKVKPWFYWKYNICAYTSVEFSQVHIAGKKFQNSYYLTTGPKWGLLASYFFNFVVIHSVYSLTSLREIVG